MARKPSIFRAEGRVQEMVAGNRQLESARLLECPAIEDATNDVIPAKSRLRRQDAGANSEAGP
jgi:hypothetical protein